MEFISDRDANSIHLWMSRHPTGADMTLHISEDIAACLVNWSIVSVILNTMPPRDPNDDDDDEEEDEDRDNEPPVVREPDDNE
jgi:hypothetical protein